MASSRSEAQVEPRHGRIATLLPTGKCALGEAGAPAELGGVAVNEATHDIYVVDKGKHRVDKLGPEGECLATVGLTAAEQIAVDNTKGPSGGAVYVTVATKAGEETREGVRKLKDEGSSLKSVVTIAHYIDTEVEKTEEHKSFEEQGEEVLGVSVDTNGQLWIYATSAIYDFNNLEKNAFVSRTEVATTCSALPGFASSATGAPFFAMREFENPSGECESEPPVMVRLSSGGEPETQPEPLGLPYYAQLDDLPTTGGAVDTSTGKIYFDNGSSVEAFNPSGKFVERFGEEKPTGEQPLEQGHGIAVNAATDEVIVPDAATKTIDIFGPRGEEHGGEPSQEDPSHPDGRQYELVNPPDKHGGGIKGHEPAGGGLVQASESGNALAFASTAPIIPEARSTRSPESTENLALRTPGGWDTQSLAIARSEVPTAIRAGSGSAYRFFSNELTSAIVEQNPDTTETKEPPLSPEATETTVYRRSLTLPESTCAPLQSSCFEAIVGTNDTSATFGDNTTFIDATNDAQHVIVGSKVPLNGEGEAREVAAAAAENGHLYYEWTPGPTLPGHSEPSGTLQLINEPPAAEKLEAGQEPSEGQAVSSHIGEFEVRERPGHDAAKRNAISTDGQRVIWQNETEGGRLYLRDLPRHETVRLDVPEAGVEGGVENGKVRFGIADSTAHTIFFTDEKHLTTNATGRTLEGTESETLEGEADLYVCELQEEAGKAPFCKLKDLTAGTAAPLEPASVQAVIGEGEEETANGPTVTVYFVANGILAPGAGPGHCGNNSFEGEKEQEELNGPLVAQGCSLYMVRREAGHWQAPRLIAPLLATDDRDWRTAIPNSGPSARVSPNGRYVAFMSAADVTGYDNASTAPEAKGAPVEEVYIDDSSKEKGLTCVSCNRVDPETGKALPPRGLLDTKKSGEGVGLIIDRPETWGEGTGGFPRWIAGNIPGWTGFEAEYGLYLSRVLSNSGRLFFNATEQLVPADKNEKADVYEFEPAGVGSCTSANGCINLISSGKSEHEAAFLDASASGNDVFIFTDSQLSPLADNSYNIYDAHVCTAESPCMTSQVPTESKCVGEEQCKVSAPEAPAPPPVGPTSQTGPGNSPRSETLRFQESGKPGNNKPTHLTKAQELAKALKACRRKHNKHQRALCERSAHKRFGKAAAHKGKKASRRKRR